MIKKYLSPLALLLMLAGPGCSSEKAADTGIPKNDFPAKGNLYFKSDQASIPEYVHLQFDNENISGTIYTEEEVVGEIFYTFKGKISADTLLSLDVHYIPEDIPQEWVIRLTDSKLSLKNSLGREGMMHYTAISNKQMPDTSAYWSVEEIEKDEEAEYLENLPDTSAAGE